MKMISAEILTIGDEILYGQITDTNSQWIASQLVLLGISVSRKFSIGDNEMAIKESVRESLERSSIVLITGGLGPTKDDITKKTLAAFFESPMALRPEALAQLEHFFASRGKVLSETNKSQAVLPTKAEYIPNSCGTAPGMLFEKEGKIVVSMPGVPFEMKEMMRLSVLPIIAKRFVSDQIVHAFAKTVGIGESVLSDMFESWEKSLPAHIKLAYLPGFSEVTLRLTARGADKEALQDELQKQFSQVTPLFEKHIYSRAEGDNLPLVIGRLLKEKGKNLVTAESCTGGFIAHLLTSIPGSSDYFLGSTIAYDNEIKSQELGVPKQYFLDFGAVSQEVVEWMAKSALKKMKADYAIATTGIAGPGGGTKEKPVGTVWIAVSWGDQVVSQKLQLGNLREVNIRQTAQYALYLLWKKLTGRE